LAFERSTNSEGVRRELKAELGGYWNKRVGNKGTFSLPQIESRSSGYGCWIYV